MKRHIARIFAAVAAALAIPACSDRPADLYFTDFFVYVKDEGGNETTRVLSTADNLVVTYYFYLVSEEIEEPLTLNYEVVCGDGLEKGVDFALQNESGSVTFEKGIYRKPFRIIYKKREVDPDKDNTVTIRITSTSDPSITLGYPGPNSRYSTHVITKYNL